MSLTRALETSLLEDGTEMLFMKKHVEESALLLDSGDSRASNIDFGVLNADVHGGAVHVSDNSCNSSNIEYAILDVNDHSGVHLLGDPCDSNVEFGILDIDVHGAVHVSEVTVDSAGGVHINSGCHGDVNKNGFLQHGIVDSESGNTIIKSEKSFDSSNDNKCFVNYQSHYQPPGVSEADGCEDFERFVDSVVFPGDFRASTHSNNGYLDLDNHARILAWRLALLSNANWEMHPGGAHNHSG